MEYCEQKRYLNLYLYDITLRTYNTEVRHIDLIFSLSGIPAHKLHEILSFFFVTKCNNSVKFSCEFHKIQAKNRLIHHVIECGIYSIVLNCGGSAD